MARSRPHRDTDDRYREAERAVHDAGIEDDALIDRIDRLARLLDTQFSLFGFRFGIDGLIGLIPGIGDAATAIMSLYLIVLAARAGASLGLIVQMIANVIFDMVIGAVPVLGDLFDFTFRANARNARLLHAYLAAKRAR
ncbi:MAG: DUF4112 domain-containing protein [Pseudomonadota bacterium]